MRIIIPMAGRGTRLRPHTLTVPKPLLSIAGKSIVERIAEDLTLAYPGEIEEIAFIIGDFGADVEAELLDVAKRLGAKGSIYHQEKALGTGHAILCAANSLDGPLIVAFADTLFRAKFTFDPSKDGFIWAMKVEDPSAYGVLKLHADGHINEFVEKPDTFVSDLAVVGIYYFKDGARLRQELQYLIDNDIKDKGEYQLTTALENLKNSGLKFYPAQIDEWLDCGNAAALVNANTRILEFHAKAARTHPSAIINNSTIIEPCFIAEGVTINNSAIGPGVSIGKGSSISNSVISNSILQGQTQVVNTVMQYSILGQLARHSQEPKQVNIGDYSSVNA